MVFNLAIASGFCVEWQTAISRLMVSTPTVLILGAGASIPYGFPSGADLVANILDLIRPAGTMPPGINSTLKKMGFADEIQMRFRRELLCSQFYSIDAFLEHRPEFMEVGKAAIATILIPYENEETLLNSSTGCYRYIFNRLVQNHKNGAKNQLTIVTFNYDRSIDHYLYTAFKAALGLSEKDAGEFMDRIPIFHVHGSLCPLPWQKKEADVCRMYNENNPDLFKYAAKCINIIHEEDRVSKSLTPVLNALGNASIVCFLGFGYHTTNLKRLLRTNWHTQPTRPQTIGTALGMTDSEQSLVRKGMKDCIGLHDLECLPFLRKFADFLS
jgi:hypothetical protein